ncbi:MAG: flagellar basal body rod protein FlgC [Planctomyces sp.]|nr:flagellar basal body rod protein FlgC [Planctomyces sp.]
MASSGMFSVTQIASSGLSAERLRMEIAATNIANADTTRTANGGPYRRQQVVFANALEHATSANAQSHLKGVQVGDIVEDESELPSVYLPGHPDANGEGFVQYPNVQMAREMVDLMTASRAYEANLKSLQAFKTMTEQSLALLKGS